MSLLPTPPCSLDLIPLRFCFIDYLIALFYCSWCVPIYNPIFPVYCQSHQPYFDAVTPNYVRQWSLTFGHYYCCIAAAEVLLIAAIFWVSGSSFIPLGQPALYFSLILNLYFWG